MIMVYTEQQFQRAVSEAAAVRASEDIMIAFSQAGYPKEQSKAARDAAVEFLVRDGDYTQKALTHLANAGFTKQERGTIIGMMAVSLDLKN